MFVRSLALAATASLSLGVAANAAGWGGYYIGFNAGMGWSDAETERAISGTGYFAASSITAIQDASAMSLYEGTFTGGAQAGLNWPVAEGVFLGLEVDAQAYSNELRDSATVDYPCCAPADFTTTNSIDQTWYATARARIGFGRERFMVYATGGYAGASVQFTQTFSDTFGAGIPLQTISNSEYLSGYALGAGVEVMIDGGASVKLEYLYVDLGEITATGPIAVATRTSTGRAAISDQLLRIGFNFQVD